jgi:hypothetical protein
VRGEECNNSSQNPSGNDKESISSTTATVLNAVRGNSTGTIATIKTTPSPQGGTFNGSNTDNADSIREGMAHNSHTSDIGTHGADDASLASKIPMDTTGNEDPESHFK